MDSHIITMLDNRNSYAWVGIRISTKHFWRRCRGVATNPVDLKRARGNLQLHCKSGTFFTFLFNLFLVRNLSGCFLDGVRVVHVGLGSQRATPTCKNFSS